MFLRGKTRFLLLEIGEVRPHGYYNLLFSFASEVDAYFPKIYPGEEIEMYSSV